MTTTSITIPLFHLGLMMHVSIMVVPQTSIAPQSAVEMSIQLGMEVIWVVFQIVATAWAIHLHILAAAKLAAIMQTVICAMVSYATQIMPVHRNAVMLYHHIMIIDARMTTIYA